MKKLIKKFICAFGLVLFLSVALFISGANSEDVSASPVVGRFDLCNGTVLTELPTETPKWESNYEFIGWYTKPILGEKVESGFAPNKTYYAHWRKATSSNNKIVFTSTIIVNENGILYDGLKEGEELQDELYNDYGIGFSGFGGEKTLLLEYAEINTENLGIKVNSDITINSNRSIIEVRIAETESTDINACIVDATGYDLTIYGFVSMISSEIEDVSKNVNLYGIKAKNLVFDKKYSDSVYLHISLKYIDTATENIKVNKRAIDVTGNLTGNVTFEYINCCVFTSNTYISEGIKVAGLINLGQGSSMYFDTYNTHLEYAVSGTFANDGANVFITGSKDNDNKTYIENESDKSTVTINIVESYHFAIGNGEVYDYPVENPVWDEHIFQGWYDSDYNGHLVTVDGVNFEEGFEGFELGKTYYAYWKVSETNNNLILLHPIVIDATGIKFEGETGEGRAKLSKYGISVVADPSGFGILYLNGAFIYAPNKAITLNLYDYTRANVVNVINVVSDSYICGYSANGENVAAIFGDYANLKITGNGDLYCIAEGTNATNGRAAYEYGIKCDGALEIDLNGNIYASSGDINHTDGTRMSGTYGLSARSLLLNNGNVYVSSGYNITGYVSENFPLNVKGILDVNGGSIHCSFDEDCEEFNLFFVLDLKTVEKVNIISEDNIDKYSLQSYASIKLSKNQEVIFEPAYIFDKLNDERVINEIPLADPTWDNHVFLGWYDALVGGNKIESDYEKGVRYYAHWQVSSENTNLIFPYTLTVTADGLVYDGIKAPVSELSDFGISYEENVLTLNNAFIFADKAAIISNVDLNIAVVGNSYVGTYNKYMGTEDYDFYAINVSGAATIDGSGQLTISAGNLKPVAYKATLCAIKADTLEISNVDTYINTGNIEATFFTEAINVAVYTNTFDVEGNVYISAGSISDSSSSYSYGVYNDQKNVVINVTGDSYLSVNKGATKSNSETISGTINATEGYEIINQIVENSLTYKVNNDYPIEVTNDPVISFNVTGEISYSEGFSDNYGEISLINVDPSTLTIEWPYLNENEIVWVSTPTDGLSAIIVENEGKYYVEVTVDTDVNAGNYEFRITNGELETSTDFVCRNVNIVVNKIEATVVKAPSLIDGLEYNGSAQELVVDGEAIGGHFEYSLDYGQTYSSQVPTAIDKNFYPVMYKLVADENYYSDESTTYLFVDINEGTITYTEPTVKTGLVYNGSKQVLLDEGTCSCGNFMYSTDYTGTGYTGYATWTDDISSIKEKNVGEYTIWYYVTDPDYNCKDTEPASIKVSIAPAEIVDNPFAVFGSYTYTGSAITPYLDCTIEDAEYSITFANGVDHTNAGTEIPFTVTLTGNYNGSFDMDFDIGKASISECPFTLTGEYEYNGLSQTPTLLSDIDDITYEISFEDGVDHKNVGTDIPFIVTLTGNYSGEFEMEFSIEKKTITVNPFTVVDSIYSGSPITPAVTCSIDDADFTIKFDEKVDYTNIGEDIPFEVVLDGNYDGSFDMTFCINRQKVTENPFAVSGTYYFKGTAITPSLSCSLTDAEYEIKAIKNVDYINAGNNLKFNVELTGNYEGTFELSFNILPCVVTDNPFTVNNVTYDCKELDPELESTIDDIEYTISYKTGVDHTHACTKIPFTVTLTGNYSGSFEMEFDILAKEIKDNPFEVVGTYVYDGIVINPNVKCSIEDAVYEISVAEEVNHTNAANDIPFTVTLTGNYSGSFEMTFDIERKLIEVNPFNISDAIYNGDEITPSVTCSIVGAEFEIDFEEGIDHTNAGNDIPFSISLIGDYQGTFDVTFNINKKNISENPFVALSATFSGEELLPILECEIEDATYEVSFGVGIDHTNAGSDIPFTVILTGNYEGMFDMTFDINKKAINDNPFTLTGSYTYNGNALTPELLCTINDCEYEVKFNDGVNHTNAANNIPFSVVLKGNYEGSFAMAFDIKKLSITVTPDNNLNKTYGENDSNISYTYSPELISGDTFSGALTREEGENVGSYKILLGSLNISNDYDIIFVEDVNYEIKARNVSESEFDLELDYNEATFNGNNIKPNVVVTDTALDKALVEETDYAITYSNNKNVGTAKVTITLIGNYFGTIEKEFTINKAKVSLEWLTKNYIESGIKQDVKATYKNVFGDTVYVDNIKTYLNGVETEFKVPGEYVAKAIISDENYAIDGSDEYTYIMKKANYEAENGKLVIDGGENPDTKLVITEGEKADYKDILKESSDHKGFDKTLYVYDFEIVDENNEVVKNDFDATISIKIPEKISSNKFKVYEINGDTAEMVEFEIVDGYVVIHTNGTAKFAFVKTNVGAILLLVLGIILVLAILIFGVGYILYVSNKLPKFMEFLKPTYIKLDKVFRKNKEVVKE